MKQSSIRSYFGKGNIPISTSTQELVPAEAEPVPAGSVELEAVQVAAEITRSPAINLVSRIGPVLSNTGCGNGKYLNFNSSIYKIGLDRCSNLTNIAREKDHEVLVSDNLALPFRDECFDAVLSIAVIHHFATTERRVEAIRELARVLRIGGRLIVSVWAMEQRHRKFESQDVLVPWNRPLASSDEKGGSSSIERDLNSTTTTSDDDATHYHAYTQTSDSDSYPSLSGGCRKRGRIRHRGRSIAIDPTCPSSQSSSDLSSPNESCYSFVRRALQKLAGTKRNRGGRRPWFLQGLDFQVNQEEEMEVYGSLDDDFDPENINNSTDHFMPIELRQLESTEFAELLQRSRGDRQEQQKMLFSNVLYPRRRRTLETTCEIHQSNSSYIGVQPKSKSLSDLFGLIPVGLLSRSGYRKTTIEDLIKKSEKRDSSRGASGGENNKNVESNNGDRNFLKENENNPSYNPHSRSHSGSSEIYPPSSASRRQPQQELDDHYPSDYLRCHKAVQTDSFESLIDIGGGSGVAIVPGSNNNTSNIALDMLNNSNISDSTNSNMINTSGASGSNTSSKDKSTSSKNPRPTLVKQKHSICSNVTPHVVVESSIEEDGESNCGSTSSSGGGQKCHCQVDPNSSTSDPVVLVHDPTCWSNIRSQVRDLPEFRPASTEPTSTLRPSSLGTFWKQTSLNEDLIFTERIQEKEKLKQHIQKQCSLNEELIYKQRENTKWDQMKEAFLNSPNVKCLQLLKNGISNRFRNAASGSDSSTNFSTTNNGEYSNNVYKNSSSNLQQSSPNHNTSNTSSLRNGLVRMLQNWKQGEGGGDPDGYSPGSSIGSSGIGVTPSSSNFGGNRRGSKEGKRLFPPFFLRRSSAGSLNNKDPHSSSKVLSPPPFLRRPSDNEIQDGSNGKLIPGVRHVRKLSREESDSSKDSSFQSDTSVDSEDSFASVIFIPKPSMDNQVPNCSDGYCFNSETRANSTDSERSPKSPASRLSPPNSTNTGPRSPNPSPLAIEINRRKSPDVSPSKINLYTSPTNATPSSASTCSTSSGFVSSSNKSEITKFAFDEAAMKMLTCDPVTNSTISSSSIANISEKPTRDTDIDEQVEILDEENSSILQRQEESGEGVSSNLSQPLELEKKRKKSSDKIYALRKSGNEKSLLKRQLVGRILPKEIAVELYNPEIDDCDTSSNTSSSSPNSVSSVVSVVNEEEGTTTGLARSSSPVNEERSLREPLLPYLLEETAEHLELLEKEDLRSEEKLKLRKTHPSANEDPPTTISESTNQATATTWQTSSSTTILESAENVVSSLENYISHSSPKARRKLTLARLGSTSKWLSSLPSQTLDSTSNQSQAQILSTTQTSGRHSPLSKRSSSADRRSGEKILLGEVKKFQPKGPDAKWPSSIIDESPPNTATGKPPQETSLTSSSSGGVGGDKDQNSSNNGDISALTQSTSEFTSRLVDELEEKDSLFGSFEDLKAIKQQQSSSRNPSIDSSIRMSSTCSCSIRGGDSFDSWTSAKSSLTNSSSNQPPPQQILLPKESGKNSQLPLLPLQGQSTSAAAGFLPSTSTSGNAGRHHTHHHHHHRGGSSSKSSSAVSAEENDSTALSYHRYYHVFREGELDKLIEKYVQNLHIISSYYDHANWCIIAEKVQVWTI